MGLLVSKKVMKCPLSSQSQRIVIWVPTLLMAVNFELTWINNEIGCEIRRRR